MKLFYRTFGEGTPIIILHGLFGLSDNWLNIAKHLADNYKVYVLDNRNHGQSPHSLVWNYNVMVSDLKEFINDHQLKQAVIIGHSMGGKLAMRFAEIYPENLIKLVVVDIAPRYYEPHHQKVLQALDEVDFNKVKSRKDVEAVLRKHLLDEATVQFLLKNVYWKTPDTLSFRFNYPVIRANIEQIGESCFDFGVCSVPTLFIRGEKSNYITNNDINDIYQKFLQVEVITIPNAGHWVHAENPTDFLIALKSFLTQIEQ
jgi:pimeloyl-ACP methyl ester carboxylesterase